MNIKPEDLTTKTHPYHKILMGGRGSNKTPLVVMHARQAGKSWFMEMWKEHLSTQYLYPKPEAKELKLGLTFDEAKTICS